MTLSRRWSSAVVAAVALSQLSAFPVLKDSKNILFPDKSPNKESPAELRGRPYLPLVAACQAAEPKKPVTRHSQFMIWEYEKEVGIPSPSFAQNYIDLPYAAIEGQRTPYTLLLVIDETKGAPRGRYTNGALVYTSLLEYCLFDMPARTLAAKDSFKADPPAQIGETSNSYAEHRRELAAFLAGLPEATADAP